MCNCRISLKSFGISRISRCGMELRRLGVETSWNSGFAGLGFLYS